LAYVLGVLAVGAVSYSTHQLCQHYDISFNQEQPWYDEPVYNQEQTGIKNENTIINENGKGREKGKDNEIKGGPPRDKNTGNYLPDPAAEGSEHTTLGNKQGRRGPYTQGATFDNKGKFRGRTDVTNHGRSDHPNPHYHTETGQNSANSPPQPITYELLWNMI
jgi:hypothetical protein